MSSFENDMKDAFEGVEFKPSEKLWAGIESAIVPKKKKGIFFMWQTYGMAASLLLAIGFAFLWSDGFFEANNTGSTESLTEVTKEEDDDSQDDVAADSSNTKPPTTNDFNNSSLAANGTTQGGNGTNSKGIQNDDLLDKTKNNAQEAALKLQAKNADQNDVNQVVIDSKPADLLSNKVVADLRDNRAVKPDELKADPTVSALDPISENIATDITLETLQASSDHVVNTDSIIKVNAAAMATQALQTSYRERSLNGSFGNNVLNISSGLGSANSSQTALRDPNTANSLSEDVDNEEGEALGAISAGIGFSFELGKRLTMNFGIRYSEFKFRNTSNAYSIENGALLPVYIPFGFDDENVFYVGSYNIDNTIQSLFLQSTISYKIASLGKFDIAVQAGVGLDYFLAYKVKGDLNFLQTRKVNPGESDFLSRTNLSGISGLSVNYRLNPNLGISADFNYRKFFSAGDLNRDAPSSAIGFGLSVNYFLNKKED